MPAVAVTDQSNMFAMVKFYRAAQAAGVPCIAIAGSVGDDLGDLHSVGLDAVFSLASGPLTLEESMADAAALLEKSAEQALRCFLAGRTLEP